MLIECTKNNIKQVDSRQLEAMRINHGDGDYLFNVSLNNRYIVYGVALVSGVRNYLLCFPDGYHENTAWYIEDLFSVIDETPSKYWVEMNTEGNNTFDLEAERVWLHESLAGINNVFSSFKTHGSGVIEKFYKYKLLFDSEFSYLKVDSTANRIDVNWLMCPYCESVWEENVKNAYEVCVECKTLLNRQ